MAQSSRWYTAGSAVVSANVAYTALSSLGTIGPLCDRAHVSAAETASSFSGQLTFALHGQRVADDLWVNLSASTAGVEVSSSGSSESGMEFIELPPGVYDNFAYVVGGGGVASGSATVVTCFRVDSDA